MRSALVSSMSKERSDESRPLGFCGNAPHLSYVSSQGPTGTHLSCRKKRTVLRHLIGDDQSIRSNDEILAGSLHHFFRNDRELVGDQNMFDLHHQTLNEANIASRDAKNGGNGLLVSKIIGMS